MLVSVRGGRAVEVRGDPEHPFTRGGLCVKVNNYVDKAYSPDRVLNPMRRSGPKGSGQFSRVSWDEALDEIAGRFRASIARHGPATVMPVSYLGTEGILNGLNVGDPFFNKIGATITERTYCDSGACTAYTMTIGATAGVDPESLAHSQFILIWACNMISTNLHLWPFVAEAQRRGAKVVVIDPVRHRTAAHADWYIPIRPGTDGALALAMMNVIIGESLADDHVHHGQRERAVGAGPDRDVPVRVRGRPVPHRVDHHDLGAAALRLGDERPQVQVRRDHVAGPDQDEAGGRQALRTHARGRADRHGVGRAGAGT